ncbi:hypothetical protein MTR67_039648, partial [Solanum verrucosum]
MPIKWVLRWQPNTGTTVNSQILIEVSNCAESINGVKEGRWKNTFTFYNPILKGNDWLWKQSHQCKTIMENLQSYRMKVAVNCEGFQYRLGDFRLRVGKVIPINSETLRGIVMEMEYLSISSWEISHLIMSEFFEIWKETLKKRSLSGHFVHVEPKFSEFGLFDQYTSQHTVVQYASNLGSNGSNISIITRSMFINKLGIFTSI